MTFDQRVDAVIKEMFQIGCKELPCERFTKDLTLSEEQNEAGLRALLANLSRLPRA